MTPTQSLVSKGEAKIENCMEEGSVHEWKFEALEQDFQ